MLARIGRLRMLRGLPFSNVLGLWSEHSCSWRKILCDRVADHSCVTPPEMTTRVLLAHHARCPSSVSFEPRQRPSEPTSRVCYFSKPRPLTYMDIIQSSEPSLQQAIRARDCTGRSPCYAPARTGVHRPVNGGVGGESSAFYLFL